MRLKTLLLFISLFATIPVYGQENSRPIKCRLLLFPPGGATETITAGNESEIVKIQLSASRISKPSTVNATDNVIRFFAEDRTTPIGNVAVPKNISSAVFVFIRDPQDEAKPFRIMVVDDSPESFPKGGAYIMNFLNSDIRFRLGERTGALKPGKSFGYQMPEKRDSFNMAPVIVDLFHDKKWITASESTWRFLPKVRYLVFVFLDPISGRPRVRSYDDIVRASN